MLEETYAVLVPAYIPVKWDENHRTVLEHRLQWRTVGSVQAASPLHAVTLARAQGYTVMPVVEPWRNAVHHLPYPVTH